MLAYCAVSLAIFTSFSRRHMFCRTSSILCSHCPPTVVLFLIFESKHSVFFVCVCLSWTQTNTVFRFHSSPCVICLAGRFILLPWFHPLAESIAPQCSRCVNDVPLFGWHSSLCSQTPISITGCIIAQRREAAGHQAWALFKALL